MRVGLIGGTFDPIHLGHLLVAEEARVRISLDEVVFIPTGHPWMKADRQLSPSHHRLNMVRMAIASNPFFRVSSTEIDRLGLTYTSDTLEELHKDAGSADDFYFILGTDSLRDFPHWKKPSRILELCALVVAPRPGYRDMDLSVLNSIEPSSSDRGLVLEGPIVDVSGKEIRSRVGQGLSVRYWVPDDVEGYIYRFGLYRDREIGQ